MTTRRIESELLTVPEAAAELRLSVETVRRALRSGDLPGIRLRRSWRVAVDDVRALRTHREIHNHRRRDTRPAA